MASVVVSGLSLGSFDELSDPPGIASSSSLRTSANPGMTRATSTRLKLSLDPPIYSIDSPGVMLPYLGHGDIGRERGVKLALIGDLFFISVYNFLILLQLVLKIVYTTWKIWPHTCITDSICLIPTVRSSTPEPTLVHNTFILLQPQHIRPC